MRCLGCNGEGTVRLHLDVAGVKNIATVDCPACGGKGQLPEPVQAPAPTLAETQRDLAGVWGIDLDAQEGE